MSSPMGAAMFYSRARGCSECGNGGVQRMRTVNRRQNGDGNGSRSCSVFGFFWSPSTDMSPLFLSALPQVEIERLCIARGKIQRLLFC